MVSLRSSAAHVFVGDLDTPLLSDHDRHHLERALRLRVGEVVTVADGAGRWRPCLWRGGGLLEPSGAVRREPDPTPAVTVGFALTKGERPDWVVQKLTEVGVDVIVPVVAARSVVQWDEGTRARRTERWRRLAREAAMQSRRARLPEVEAVRPLPEAMKALGSSAALAEPGGSSLSLDRPAVVVGPEGGWSGEELELGAATVGLGPTVMRAETAALATAVLLCALRAGLVAAGA